MTESLENNLFRRIVKGSVALLLVMTLAGGALFSSQVAYSILAGGLIAIVNFYWMRSVLQRLFGLQPAKPSSFVQLRFLARLAVTGLVLYGLIVSGRCSIVALIAGLSVVVINIIAFSIYSALRTGG